VITIRKNNNTKRIRIAEEEARGQSSTIMQWLAYW